MQTFIFIKKFIAKQIKLNGNSCKNIVLRTREMRASCKRLTNDEIFSILNAMQNAGSIKIKLSARPRKIYKGLKTCLSFCQKISRYVIDILQMEYFDIPDQLQCNVTNEKWAIKTTIDTTNWIFIVKLKGIDENLEFKFKPAAKQQKTKLMEFWEQAQNNPDAEISCMSFKKPHDSLRAFFKEFCPELQKFVIDILKGGRSARFNTSVSPEILKHNNFNRLIFNKGKEDKEKRYQCTWDESGTFLGWKRVG